MHNVLEQLYYGEINPSLHDNSKRKAYELKKKALELKEKRLTQKLDDELQIELEDLIIELYNFMPEDTLKTFINGFSLGVELMIETLYK